MGRRVMGWLSNILRSNIYYPVSCAFLVLVLMGISVNLLIHVGDWPPTFIGQHSPVTISTVAVASPQATVHALILGDVHTPGLYTLPPGSRVRDLIEIAGGAHTTADLTRVQIDALLIEGESVYLPQVGETIPPERDGRLELNQASTNQLHQALGITSTIARRIVEYRTAHGPFSAVSQLLLVPVAKTTFDRIKDLVTV